MNRIAYIISADRDDLHLKRLINALDYNADFYVHVDIKSDILSFKKQLGDKVIFVPSHWISWGAFSQVEYQKELLGAVINSGIKYSRIVSLSGLDYPLEEKKELYNYFIQNSQKELISGYKLSHSNNKQQLSKITIYHFFRDLKWKNQWWKNKIIVLSRITMKILPIRKKNYTWINGKRVDVYMGSSWWGITLPCAHYVYNKLCTENRMMNYFKTSFTPDEMCIQTIVFNSPFAQNAILHEGEYPGLEKLTPLHYINYGKCIKILTEEDYITLKNSNKMFCRKVVSGTSDKLVQLINSSHMN